jgi:hypothetical protein
VSYGPYRDLNSSYPQNSELKKRRDNVHLLQIGVKIFCIWNIASKKMPSFVFIVLYLVLVLVVKDFNKHGLQQVFHRGPRGQVRKEIQK